MATSVQKIEMFRPVIRHLAATASQTALTDLGVPALLLGKLTASVGSKVDGALDEFLGRGADQVDEWLGNVERWAAALRSDLTDEYLPEPRRLPAGPDQLRAMWDELTRR